jgi:hypothetical protein
MTKKTNKEVIIEIMKRILGIVSATVLAITLSGCGYDGHYRYHCQDPVNWEAEECKPPVCKAAGYCTKDLLGFDPLATESATIEEDIIEEASDEVEENEE